MKTPKHAKTPHGKYVYAEMALEKWLSRLIRCSKMVERFRKQAKYYRNYPVPRREKQTPTGARNVKKEDDVWTPKV